MKTVAILSFPGNNCEIGSIRAIERNGMTPMFFRWNDDPAKLKEADAYFIPGGFAYEDRGRAGMIAGRDPVIEVIKEEAAKGKVVIGICNGAQVLVESGLIPLNKELKMSLARNAIGDHAPGFLNEWIYITPTCARDRCAVSNWDGAIQIPIAHGEGRFATEDKDLYEELKANDQIAFSYCDESGKVSDDPIHTPNGSMYAIAGICNPGGNVIALMPHPERTRDGDPYFKSMREWIIKGEGGRMKDKETHDSGEFEVSSREPKGTEIFIDTIIVNNEERTVEQAAHRNIPSLKLRQLKYISIPEDEPKKILDTIALFNANKEVAYIRRGDKFTKWNADTKQEEEVESPLLGGISLLRRDTPDTGASGLKKGSETGVCYVCSEVKQDELMKPRVLEIFANPHASTLEVLA